MFRFEIRARELFEQERNRCPRYLCTFLLKYLYNFALALYSEDPYTDLTITAGSLPYIAKTLSALNLLGPAILDLDLRPSSSAWASPFGSGPPPRRNKGPVHLRSLPSLHKGSFTSPSLPPCSCATQVSLKILQNRSESHSDRRQSNCS